jgi:hypothetical protein
MGNNLQEKPGIPIEDGNGRTRIANLSLSWKPPFFND